MYTAAVITPRYQAILKELLEELCPNTYQWVGHHATIRMGYAIPGDNLGDIVKLRATHFSKDERVCAVKVEGINSVNKVAHITLAVNREAGAKPKDSNSLTSWTPLGELIDQDFISLVGVVQEVG